MISHKTLAAGLGAAVALSALAGAGTASAQSYYDQCQRDSSNNATTGAVVGGLGGAVVGNQLSARGRHTENTLLGGAVGAVAGALIGKGSTNCANYSNSYAPPPPPPPQAAYDNRAYDNRGYDGRGYYADGYYAPPPPPPPTVVYAAPPVYYAPPVYVDRGYYYGRRHGWYGW